MRQQGRNLLRGKMTYNGIDPVQISLKTEVVYRLAKSIGVDV